MVRPSRVFWVAREREGRKSLTFSASLCSSSELGQDFWLGTGKVLVAGCYFPGVVERKVSRVLPSLGARL